MGFLNYIKKGNLDKAKEYFINNPNYNIHAENEKAFRLSCNNCYLDVAKWLWNISNHKINIHTEEEGVFRWGCENGYLDVVKWLWNISNHKINIHAADDFAFSESCKSGHLEVAKWLLTLDFDYFVNWIKENEIKMNEKIKCELQNIIDKKMIENMIQSRPQINKDTIVVI
jgi:hypothetical protein